MASYNPYRRVPNAAISGIRDFYEHPGPLSQFADGRSKTVCVIGGGIAGLTAAYELKENGHHVVLYEASERFGGRILTHKFNDGTYGELGAMRIPEDHKCVLHYVDELGLAPLRRRFVHKNANGFLHFRGRCERIAQWYKLLEAEAAYSDLHPKLMNTPADELLTRIIGEARTSVRDFGQFFEGRLETRTLRNYELLTLYQYLRGFEYPRQLRSLTETPPSAEPRLSADDWEYIGRATGKLWEEQASFLAELLDEISFMNPIKWELVGGIDTLTQAFVQALGDACKKHAAVTRIVITGDQVEVHVTSGGADHIHEFDYVICAVPASATVAIQFDPPLASSKYEALTNLSYGSASKSIVHCKQRFWEQEPDWIFGGASYTDLPIQQVWYPSDNATPETAGDNLMGVAAPSALDGPNDMLGSDVVVDHVVWKAIDPDRSKTPGVLIGSYLWGTNARRFASLNESERTELVLSSLRELHPALSDEGIEDVVHHSWDAAANPGGGAFALFAPGERERYQESLWAAHPEDDPRVFFAGEHLSILHAWIQGAMSTALAAAIDVLTSPPRGN